MSRFVLLLVLLWALPGFADESSSISVTGSGSVRVVPDKVAITVGFVTSDKLALQAKNKSDAAMRGIIAAAKKIGVQDKDIRTDFVQLDLEGSYRNDDGPRLFQARRSLRVLLHTVAQFDALTAALFQAGANSLSEIEFGHSKQADFQKQSYILALKNARETAEILAKEAGLKLGVAKSISFGGHQGGFGGPGSARGMAASVAIGPSIAQGEIVLTTDLSVEFEAKK